MPLPERFSPPVPVAAPPQTNRFLWSIALLMASASGCAQTASVTYQASPSIDPARHHQLAVVPSVGDENLPLADELERRLSGLDEFHVTQRELLDPEVVLTGFPDRPSLDERFRRAELAGVDVLIVAELEEYGVDDPEDSPVEDQGTLLGWWPRGTEVDTQLAVSMRIKAYDVADRKLLLTRDLARRAEAESDDWDDQQAQLVRLSGKAIDDFVADFSPRTESIDVALAVGDWYSPRDLRIRRGVRLAHEGRWDDAERLWQSVADHSPDSDAAFFNLAIAATQRGDYKVAEDLAMQALRLRHTECYTDGLQLIREIRKHAERLAEQPQRETGEWRRTLAATGDDLRDAAAVP